MEMPKILEIIALPGAGKTSISIEIVKKNSKNTYLIQDKNFVYKVFSQLISPVSILIFYKFYFDLIKFCLSSNTKINFSRAMYFLMVNNFQLTRFFEAKIMKKFGKNVIIDEGLFFNIIRMKCCFGGSLNLSIFDSYLYVINRLKFNVGILIEDEIICRDRFFQREKNTNKKSIFNFYWHPEFSYFENSTYAWSELSMALEYISDHSINTRYPIKGRSISQATNNISKHFYQC